MNRVPITSFVRSMVRRRLFKAVVLAVTSVLVLGCRHKPVDANYGAAFIDCVQPRAEILIDGQTTHRFTPAEIGGIPAGQRTIRLRHVNFASLEQTVTIRPNVINRFNFTMAPFGLRLKGFLSVPAACALVIDYASGRVYVASSSGTITVAQLTSSDPTVVKTIQLGFTPRRLAVSTLANRLYCIGTRSDSTAVLAGYDLGALAAVCQNDTAPLRSVAQIAFTDNGQHLVAADTAANRLLVFTPSTGRLDKHVALAGSPSEISAGSDGNMYVASREARTFIRVSIDNGTVTGSAGLPGKPQGIFWSKSRRQAGVWDAVAKTVTLINTENMSTSTSTGDYGGDSLITVCWTPDPEYLVADVIKWSNVREERIISFYLPTWEIGVPFVTGRTDELHSSWDPDRIVSLRYGYGLQLLELGYY